MPTDLFSEAVSLAQAGIRVFPVNANKRPAIDGWREKATTDRDQLEEWFGESDYAGIGVPCGPEQDLICFDIDLGHTEDEERKDKLRDWLTKWANVKDDGYILRKTRSGGYHLLFGWGWTGPESSVPIKYPRRLMPKLDVIIDGFYFVWNTRADDYSHVRGDWDDVVAAPDGIGEVVETATGGDGSAMMPLEEAVEVMMTNGDAGIRHDALLALTQDWADRHPGQPVSVWCEGFEKQFREVFGGAIDAARMDQLMQWEDGRGELWRAFSGVRLGEEHAGALLEKAGEKLRAEGRLVNIPTPVSEQLETPPAEIIERVVGEFTDIDLGELRGRELPDIDWIVDDLLPAGNLVSITGPSGAGKTRFTSLLMAALSTGSTQAIGLPKAERAIRSLYVANEERTEDVERRLKAAAVLNDLPGDMLITVRGKEHGRFYLIDGKGEIAQPMLDALVEAVNARGVELVMVDPIVTVGIEEENAAASVSLAMEALQEVASRTGACVLYVHHSPKGERGAAEDLLRGDSGAWRGSGVFYSSLDLGFTLMPWLPSECHDKGTGREMRRKWRHMVRNHQAPKYVVLDSAKERENEGLGSVMYEIVGQEVRVHGRRIGAMRPVKEADAQNEATMLLAQAEGIDAARDHAWAAALLDMFPEEGHHRTSLRDIARHFDVQKPAGWPTNRNPDEQLRLDRGNGERLIEVLSATHKVAGMWVWLKVDGRTVECQVSRVS